MTDMANRIDLDEMYKILQLNMADYAESVIRHELGHWITAKHFGVNVGQIEVCISGSIRNGFEHQGYAQIFPFPSIKNLVDIKQYIDQRITILIAGFYCQFLFLTEKLKEEFADYNEDQTQKSNIYQKYIASNPSYNIDDIPGDDRSKLIELITIKLAIEHPEGSFVGKETDYRNDVMVSSIEVISRILNEHIELMERSVIHMKKFFHTRNSCVSFKFADGEFGKGEIRSAQNQH